MLFSYQYIDNHPMENMQKIMDFIFNEVWLKANVLGDFNCELFNGKPDVKNIIETFYHIDNAPKWGKYFVERIENIFNLCRSLDSLQLEQLKYWYETNNEIEELCNKEHSPIMYKDLKFFNEELSKEFSKLYSKLYSKDILENAKIKEKIGSHLKEHYNAFATENNSGICPFCGLNDMKGIHHTKREAYDHYLPKGQFPFNSINFKNFAPMCHECNSSYKLEKNPIFNRNTSRRKTCYPYSEIVDSISIDITINTVERSRILPNSIELRINPENNEKINTWKELFSIDERYKATLCSESEGQEWLKEILDDFDNEDNLSRGQAINTLERSFNRAPYKRKRFLQLPFLRACINSGIIEL